MAEPFDTFWHLPTVFHCPHSVVIVQVFGHHVIPLYLLASINSWEYVFLSCMQQDHACNILAYIHMHVLHGKLEDCGTRGTDTAMHVANHLQGPIAQPGQAKRAIAEVEQDWNKRIWFHRRHMHSQRKHHETVGS